MFNCEVVQGMNVKQYLKQIRLLDKKINQRIEEKDYLKGKAATVRSMIIHPDKIQQSLKPDKMESMMVKYIDLEHEIDNLIDQYVDLKHKIIGEIQQLDNVQHVDCLVQRYVEGRSFEAIALDMGYSVRRIFQIHSDALQAFKAKHFI